MFGKVQYFNRLMFSMHTFCASAWVLFGCYYPFHELTKRKKEKKEKRVVLFALCLIVASLLTPEPPLMIKSLSVDLELFSDSECVIQMGSRCCADKVMTCSLKRWPVPHASTGSVRNKTPNMWSDCQKNCTGEKANTNLQFRWVASVFPFNFNFIAVNLDLIQPWLSQHLHSSPIFSPKATENKVVQTCIEVRISSLVLGVRRAGAGFAEGS